MKRLAFVAAVLAITACSKSDTAKTDTATPAMAPSPAAASPDTTMKMDTTHKMDSTMKADSAKKDSASKGTKKKP